LVDCEDGFWNEKFDHELPNYNEHLIVFLFVPLGIININTTSSHVFSDL
jgi:hypothetical protein